MVEVCTISSWALRTCPRISTFIAFAEQTPSSFTATTYLPNSFVSVANLNPQLSLNFSAGQLLIGDPSVNVKNLVSSRLYLGASSETDLDVFSVVWKTKKGQRTGFGAKVNVLVSAKLDRDFLRIATEGILPEGFGPEVKRRIMIGTYALSAGYYDAYYRKAQQLRRLIKNDFEAALQEVDVIMGPTTPAPAWVVGEKAKDPVSVYLEDIYTISANLAGLPGMSIPCGFVDGMPVGLQVIGNYFDESLLLNIGHQFQQSTDWHTKSAV